MMMADVIRESVCVGGGGGRGGAEPHKVELIATCKTYLLNILHIRVTSVLYLRIYSLSFFLYQSVSVCLSICLCVCVSVSLSIISLFSFFHFDKLRVGLSGISLP